MFGFASDGEARGGGKRRRAPVRCRAAFGLFAALVGACAIPAVTAQAATPVAPAYTPITVYAPKGQQLGRWSERTRVAGDLNRDGVNDLWVGVPKYKRDNPDGSFGDDFGRVYAVDGASLASPGGQKRYPKILYKIHPPEPQANKDFGFWIQNIGDVNGDGMADLVVGTDAQDVPLDPGANSQICKTQPQRCHLQQGKAWVFDGKNNRVLYELNNPKPQGSDVHEARFGSRIGRAGDVNGDGVPDVIVGASGNDNPERPGCSDDGVAEAGCRARQGQAFIFDGTDGTLIRELNLPEEDQLPPTTCQSLCGSFGLSVQGVGDVDGDGVADQAVGAPSLQVAFNIAQGRMYVFSGATGQLIRRIDDPEPQRFAFFGFQDVTPDSPGDVNDDGRADIYAMGFFQDGEAGAAQGKSWVFDGGAGTVFSTPKLYENQNPNPRRGGQFGWTMAREFNPLKDTTLTGDATNPLYVGNSPHHSPPEDERGDTNVFNLLTGAPERNLPLPDPWAAEAVGTPQNQGPNLGWTSSSPGDLNHDGFRDFIAGAPFTDVCHTRLGTNNKDLYQDMGVMIVFVSRPSNSPPPDNDPNPADNACQQDQPDVSPPGGQ